MNASVKTGLGLVLILLAGLGLGIGVDRLLSSQSADASKCSPPPSGTTSHSVMITDGLAQPNTVTGRLCDTLTIMNMDHQLRAVAFGPHEDHVPYAGVTEKVLNYGESLTLTLNQTGTFHFHDHLTDEAQGSFTVTRR